MALTPSNQSPLGTALPSFSLPDVVTGTLVSHSDFQKNPIFMVMFICKHCPYVKHLISHISQTCKEWNEKSVGIVGISSNDGEKYPDDAPESLKAMAQTENFSFPLLYDHTQEVAKKFDAACTPEFFIYNKGHLAYRGQWDDSRPGNGIPVTGKDVIAALENLSKGELPSPHQKPSIGCNIKWRTH